MYIHIHMVRRCRAMYAYMHTDMQTDIHTYLHTCVDTYTSTDQVVRAYVDIYVYRVDVCLTYRTKIRFVMMHIKNEHKRQVIYFLHYPARVNATTTTTTRSTVQAAKQ